MKITPTDLSQLSSAIRDLEDTVFKIGFLAAGCLLIFSAVVWYGIRVYERKTGFLADEFSTSKAEKLFGANQLDELLDYCEKFRKNYPNDVNVNWYMGIAFFQLKLFDQAQISFKKVASLNPNWKEPAKAYLDEIQLQNQQSAAH